MNSSDLLSKNNMSKLVTNSNYDFSATNIDDLGATEYTLVTIAVDCSGSLFGYDRDLEKMVKTCIEACKNSPRSDNLLIRLVTFRGYEEEKHGFKLLNGIDLNDYDNTINVGGSTLLYDTVYHSVESTFNYAKNLFDQNFFTNSIIFIITDGADNSSIFTPKRIKELIEKAKASEVLESISTILIGMTNDKRLKSYLKTLNIDAKLDHYIEMGNVSKNNLASLAGYMSRSISSSSQALGSGGPSQSLTF